MPWQYMQHVGYTGIMLVMIEAPTATAYSAVLECQYQSSNIASVRTAKNELQT